MAVLEGCAVSYELRACSKVVSRSEIVEWMLGGGLLRETLRRVRLLMRSNPTNRGPLSGRLTFEEDNLYRYKELDSGRGWMRLEKATLVREQEGYSCMRGDDDCEQVLMPTSARPTASDDHRSPCVCACRGSVVKKTNHITSLELTS